MSECRVLLASAIITLAAGGAATAGDLALGQYALRGVQQICLTGDGAWYGVNFAFNGHWRNAAGAAAAPLWGAYRSAGPRPAVYHDTINVTGAVADWYEWTDDGAYSTFLPAVPFTRVKPTCDAPASAAPTRAATQ